MTIRQSEVALEIQNKHNINHILARRLAQMDADEAEKFIAQKPKPFVKWVGGKRQLLEQFKRLNLYPPDGFDSTKHKYFEPFVGGGAVFFDLMPEKATLSDLNKELVITYNVIKENVEDLIKSLKEHKTDKEYYQKVRSQNPEEMDNISIASRFIFLNRTCFNGLYRVNKQGKFNVPYGKYVNPLICDVDNLRKVSKSLRDIEIKQRDYKEVLGETKEGDFIYFDPPYYPLNRTSSFTSYTTEGFFEKEQKELRDTFIELHKKGCFVMLSNSDTEFINNLYKDINGVKINKIYAGRMVNADAKKRGKITEVLITNY